MMRRNKGQWDKGTLVEVDRLGECTFYRRIILGEYYQFKIRHGFTTVIGEPSSSNTTAIDNAFLELKKKFKTILN